MADVIARTGEFQFKLDECESVYESLLEAIARQSIGGKRRRMICGARQGAWEREMASCPTPRGRSWQAADSERCAEGGAFRYARMALAMKDLAQKTISTASSRRIEAGARSARTKSWWRG